MITMQSTICVFFRRALLTHLRGDMAVGGDLTFSHIPKVLKGCLHTICQNCAEDGLQRSKDGSSIMCPLCGVSTSGVTSTSALPDNIVALQDVHRKHSHCDFCDDVAKASHMCYECASLLCTFHMTAHSVSRGTKSHRVVSLKNREASHRVQITCARHRDVEAKLFCSEPCGTTICHNCSVAEHSGHSVVFSDSAEVEQIHRDGLTRRGVSLGHRLARVRGGLDAVEAVKTGVEKHTRLAESATVQAFSAIRAAVDSREKEILKNLRADRAQKKQDLNAQLAKLGQVMRAYEAALDSTNTSLERLHGDQFLAMEPTIRECLDAREAEFPSLELTPCVEDRVEFEHDRSIANALRQGISRLGCMVNAVRPRKKKDKSTAPEQDLHASSTPSEHNIHFSLAAIVGARPQEATLASPTDKVIVEIRSGSEHDFLKNGTTGPVIGRVALHTKFKGAKHLAYETEHFFESLSQQATPTRQSRKQQHQAEKKRQKQPTPSRDDDCVPAVRFTKVLRVFGRRGEGSS
ncbi:unnamed protein product [Ectocarpus sp. 8 AP-2014]